MTYEVVMNDQPNDTYDPVTHVIVRTDSQDWEFEAHELKSLTMVEGGFDYVDGVIDGEARGMVIEAVVIRTTAYDYELTTEEVQSLVVHEMDPRL